VRSASPVFHSLVALSFTAGLASAQQGASSPREALVVTPAWVAQHLHDANTVVFHVGDPAKFAAKHIAGARFVNLSDISVSDHSGMEMPSGMTPPPEPIKGPKNGLILEMPTPEQLRSQLAKLGVSDNSRIIVYSADEWYSPTTRVVFTLDYAGLGSHSVVMDGGLEAWVRDGHPVTDVVAPEQAGKLSDLKLRPIVVDANYVRAHEKTAGVSIVDARDGSFYDGIPRARGGSGRLGHIPGAKSVPFTEVFSTDGKLKPVDQLLALFAKAGVQPSDTVVGYCHIGQQATAMLFAARTLGHPVLLYDGSFTDWEKHADFPVENPSAKKP
jgi:thiosulfate/3-mercaptopyruvate sulfurtransferase